MSTRPITPTQARLRAAKAKKRKALGLEAIVDVALAIADAEGTDAVSMRRVAAEFDTGPASLYAHVANRDELLHHLLERVVDEVGLPTAGTWQEQIRTWALEVRAVFARHADIARLTFGTIPVTPRALEVIEHVLRVMIEGGVPPQVATWAIDVTSLYIGADVYEGWLMGQRFADASGRDPEELGTEYFQRIAAGFATLPPEKYPYLTGNLDLMMNGDSDDRFSFGIDMLIAGFAAQIPS